MAHSVALLLSALLVVSVQTLQLPAQQPLTRRGALGAAGAALAVRVQPASAIDDLLTIMSRPGSQTALKAVLSTDEALKAFVKNEDAFVKGLAAGDETAIQLPQAISFPTFQALEKVAGPEFMEVAIDYAEASRNARDLVKLAKLTKQKVAVSVKEKGKPVKTVEVEYGQAEGSNLGSAEEYAKRAFQEALGASVALSAAVDLLPKQK